MGLNLGTGLGGSGLTDLSFSTGLGGSGLKRDAGLQIIQSGLIAHWKFDEGGGGTVADQSGNGNDVTLGTDAAAPTWTQTGLRFQTGDTGSPGTLGISGGDPRTVIAALRINSVADNGIRFGWLGGGSSLELWRVKIISSGAGSELWRMEFQGDSIQPTFKPVQDSVTFLAITQATASADSIIIYRDGDAEGPAISSNGTNLNTAGNFTLAFGGTAVDFEWLYGLVYDRALTSSEVAKTRAALRAILAERGVTLP